mgnify:FL=1
MELKAEDDSPFPIYNLFTANDAKRVRILTDFFHSKKIRANPRIFPRHPWFHFFFSSRPVDSGLRILRKVSMVRHSNRSSKDFFCAVLFQNLRALVYSRSSRNDVVDDEK